jgi:hypothetical protein
LCIGRGGGNEIAFDSRAEFEIFQLFKRIGASDRGGMWRVKTS